MDLRRLMNAGPTAKRRPPDVEEADATPGYTLTNDAFTVGWICALDVELAPSIAMLDEEFPNLPQILGDSNTYTLGRIGEHNIVLACLPAGTIGANAAATAATNMMRSFPNIRFCLMVGIGGGAPSMPSRDPRNDIRLGDVVVSCPTADSSGVLQYDFGKTMAEGKFVQTNTLNKTSIALRTGISKLRARHRMEESQVPLHIATMLESKDKMRETYDHPGQEHDQLFRSDYDHIESELNCEACDRGALLNRRPRADGRPVIHYGLIGSANRVMRHGMTREKLRREKGIVCFEMEAAGLMDSTPCLAIRGICDYADSHKNKRWQPYAAATAAAYAKEILSVIPAAEVTSISTTNPNAINIYDIFRSTIGKLNLEQLLQILPGLDQKQQTSDIRTLDPNDPEFSWVFRNLDYKTWESDDGPSALCLSSPRVHQLSRVSSYIVCQEEKPNRLVLYCACPQIASNKFVETQSVREEDIIIINVLICTILEQIVHLSPIEERLLILRNFVDGLLQKSFKSKTTQNWVRHGFNQKNILKSMQRFLGNVAKEDLLTTFQMTLDYTKQQYPWVVIDGIENDFQCRKFLRPIGKFVIDYQQRSPNVKVLLVGPAACDISGLPQDSLFIEHDKERKECLSSLEFDNTRYEKISSEHGGSFDWLWTHKEYRSWSVSTTSQLLYVQGKPASGKSTLTKYFNSNLLIRESLAKQAIVAKFFYSYREGETQRSHYNMFLTLLHDILRQDEAFFYHCCQAEYRAHRHDGLRVKWDYASLKRVLKSLQKYSTKNRFYLIIDAIDESDEVDRRDTLTLLYEICSKMTCCVIKIFIASRPVAQMEARRGHFLNFIRLQDETTADISNFAYSLLDGLHFDGTHLLSQAIKYIIDNAFGVFLWVKLAGAELVKAHEDGLSEEAILTLLKELPTELQDVYERMLDRMKGNSSCLFYGLKMFRFVLSAKRPLTVDELLHSLGIPDNLESNGIFDLSDEALQKRIPSSERIIHSFGGNFLEIKSDDGIRVVQVIHQTAHEFLLDQHGAVAESEFRIDKGYAHLCIAITCFRYLLVCAANNPPPERPPGAEPWIPNDYEHYAKYLNQKPLTSYALRHLKDHVDAHWDYANRDSGIRLLHLAAQIPNDWVYRPFDLLVEKWVGSHLKPDDLKKIRYGILLAAAKGGFIIASEAMVSAAVVMDLERKDVFERTALSWASGNGHEAIVRLLLQNGAKADTTDISDRTPLMWAALSGNDTIIELLLQSGASIDATDNSYGTALSHAARRGHQTSVELLLQSGASITATGNSNGTALLYAAGNGQQAIVELLLQRGASIDATDNSRGTALSYAAGNGHQAIVELLLQNGASINAIDNSYSTVLSYAARNGHRAIVELLLRSGASPNVKDRSEGRTPLSWAAGVGHQAIVELLLQSGASIDEIDGSYGTALSYAAGNGHQAIVELLLRSGASVHAVDNWVGRTPLSWAARSGNQAIAELLLQYGANPDAEEISGDTPLSWATINGHQAIVELLLRHRVTYGSRAYPRAGVWFSSLGHQRVIPDLRIEIPSPPNFERSFED
ncbi:putative kinesin [Trichoderma afarasin]